MQDEDKSPHFQLSLPSTGRRVKRVTVSPEQTSPLKATFVKSGPDVPLDNQTRHTAAFKTSDHSAVEEHEHTKVKSIVIIQEQMAGGIAIRPCDRPLSASTPWCLRNVSSLRARRPPRP
jgi:hypothetical protein